MEKADVCNIRSMQCFALKNAHIAQDYKANIHPFATCLIPRTAPFIIQY